MSNAKRQGLVTARLGLTRTVNDHEKKGYGEGFAAGQLVVSYRDYVFGEERDAAANAAWASGPVGDMRARCYYVVGFRKGFLAGATS